MIKFQFCEIALLISCTQDAKSKMKLKQDALEKLILSVIKSPDKNLKE